MPDLPDRPLLADFQAYVVQLEAERGFAGQTVVEKCLLMGEEVGELFKAIRQAEGIAIDATARVGPVADELADVFIFLCAIANRYGIDLQKAFLAKERLNKTRSWVSGKRDA
ncbi:MAG TPA: MazG nucleotide pyrophosphohydrolase domain-containing protein [Rhizomicrobium sp.]|jgi:NTP pyrophosphatase (non-canonical NTP hydrolase)|nr:MazG nucleotide pyrophosphohydrolase domain-containing protein [Rhizomicrobium sp.]